MLFKTNKKLGVLIQDSISEIELAAIFDTYHRTLPSSMHAYSLNNSAVTSQYGLILLPTDSLHTSEIDEVEIMNPEVYTKNDTSLFKNTIVIPHYTVQGKYIIDECLDRIETQYGSDFKNLVKLALDYN